MADVNIKYNNSTIATIDNTQTEVLDTSGKYLEDDIKIEYVKPAPNLQTDKYVTPSANNQTIHPDAGYEGLAYVYVNPISPRKTAQTYTPTTTNQTIAANQWLTGAQTIKGDANLVAGNIKKDVSIFGVTGTYEGSGGGGSSDFTTCTVTVINNSENEFEFYLPQITENDVYGDPSIIMDAYSGGMQSTDTFTCVLYKGKALGSFVFDSRPSQSDVTTSESISYDYNANFISITGDGTITIDY